MTKFAAWTAGKTGFPLVDAGMRQIAATGYMHNRVRMVVADFLIKLLHIDWRIGEKYFATQLIDYDTAVNNGSWQWQAGSGTDSQPYYRIYNPWIQAYKFDRECEYIKKWVPELRDVPPKDIIKWNKTYKEYTSKGIYIAPIIDYVKEKKIAIKLLAAVH
jgi:deoxyribodipyrimidine photo-lyase